MKKVTMSLPTLVFVVATRGAIAFGAGLLLARKMPKHRRRRVARALIAFGALSTVPAALAVRKQSGFLI